VHAVSAAVLVGSSTHHVLWCRGYLAGKFGRAKAERRFASIVAIAFTFTFLLGNLIYPTYKVRVRAEYFDSPQMVVHGLSSMGRLFDIKEHWVALGWAAALLLYALSRFAHPKDHAKVTRLYVGVSLFICASAWFGAIVGLITASYKSVASLR
jgi:hypothetical protein